MNQQRRKNTGRDADAIAFARNQRKTANEFADAVWQLVRNRNCRSHKFRREHPIPPFTVDFCCVALKWIIEVDGERHCTADGIEYDQLRDAKLRALGFEVLRIKGYEVLQDAMEVRKRIEQAIDRLQALNSPSPPKSFARKVIPNGQSLARMIWGGRVEPFSVACLLDSSQPVRVGALATSRQYAYNSWLA